MINKQNWIKKSRLGGLRRVQLYGNPGTPEGRAKGGRATIRKFNQNPAFARKRGFIIRKKIRYPHRSVDLAEFFGVMLGDGGLSGNHQVKVSFNYKTDWEYSRHLNDLLKKLFDIETSIHYRKGCNGADMVVSGSNLVDFLVRQGLVTGNKVKKQVGVPEWIRENPKYEKACLKGLIDTDGSFYRHEYLAGGNKHKYLKLCFTNCSAPILRFVFDVLRTRGYQVYLHGKHVSIYSTDGVKRYFKEIGTHNKKHLGKFHEFFVN